MAYHSPMDTLENFGHEGIATEAAVRAALDMLPDTLKSHASAYIDETKDIGNLIQQLKNRRRGRHCILDGAHHIQTHFY